MSRLMVLKDSTAKGRPHRLFKKAVQQGRSERRGEAYPCGTLSL